jgi:hypothetical protein
MSNGPDESDAAARRRQRRALFNDARRKVERALGTADEAEELAKAAQAVLKAAEAGQIDLAGGELAALRAALARYHEAGGG